MIKRHSTSYIYWVNNIEKFNWNVTEFHQNKYESISKSVTVAWILNIRELCKFIAWMERKRDENNYLRKTRALFNLPIWIVRSWYSLCIRASKSLSFSSARFRSSARSTPRTRSSLNLFTVQRYLLLQTWFILKFTFF